MTLAALPLPGLPFPDPVLIVATATAIFLIVPLVAERLRIPGVVGLILAGALVGPNGLGILARDSTIVLLGTVGLLYLMLLVGLELDLHDFMRYRRQSAVFGGLSFLIPAVAGTGLALSLGYSFPSALLVGSAFSSHTLLAYPIASRLGIVRHPAVTTTLGGTIVTEVLALLLLAVVVEARGGPMDLGFWTGLGLPFVVYVAGVLLILPRVARWFFRRVSRDGSSEFVFVLVALFSVSYLAHFGGVEPIVGALLAGLALNRLIPAHGPLINRIHFAGNALFIPFFLLSVGMLVNLSALDTPGAWGISLGLALAVVLTKGAAAAAAAKVFGFGRAEAGVMFGLSVPHAAGTLAIVLVGSNIGMLDQAEVNGVVLMILLTCILGPWLVQRYGPRLGAAAGPVSKTGGASRVMIAVSNRGMVEPLLDLAFLVRSSPDEPIRALTVVLEAGGATAANVAAAESTLEHAVRHGAAAEIPVVTTTRVDGSVATGIVRAVEGTRTTALVLGWDADPSAADQIFGSVLDAVLRQTHAMVVVAGIGHPLATARRLLLLVPPAAVRLPGYAEAAAALHRLASGVGVPMVVRAFSTDAVPLQALHGRLHPRVGLSWEWVGDWAAFVVASDVRRDADSLTVLVGTRPESIAWHPRLERLPRRIAAPGPGNVVVLYPAEPAADAGASDSGLGEIEPDRAVILGAISFVASIGQLLGSVMDETTARELTNVVVRNEDQFSSEVSPGIVIPHVRIAGLPRPTLVLGISREGIRFPRAQAPVRLIFLLISPAEDANEHLRSLASIARTVSSPGLVAELVERYAPGTQLDWMGLEG